ncbi:MAG TPA: dihydrodipicolinate synthase family protein [Bryobacteraceae bacterium]|nr:dihydrodipicolinate synthase family protein [Bryobacteraceae bacterium]
MKGRIQQEAARLGGMIVAAPTPRRAEEYSIDLGSTLEMIDFLCQSGVKAITLLGSTGEFVHFALDDRRHMVNFAVKRSRLPLLVNVSHSTLDGAIELAREATSAGVAGILLMPPYYFRQDQDAIRSFYLAFASALGNALPIYLYNIPACTNEIASSTAVDLLASGLFAGIKDSSGNLDYFRALSEQAAQTPFTLFCGYERIYGEARGLGANGAIFGTAAAVPELLVALDAAICTGASTRIHLLAARLNEFVDWIEIFPMTVGIKTALKQRKLKMGALALPLGERGEQKLAEFGEWFRGWLPEVLRECGE